MKKINLLLLSVLLITGISSCKKEVGPQGIQGTQGEAGPEAKTFNFSLTFPTGSTFQSYSGITGFDTQDVILFYVAYEELNGETFYAPISGTLFGIDFVPEFSASTGFVFINTFATGTQNSPWNTSGALSFKAVLIKSSGLIKHPNVNFSNYEEVKKVFNLE